MYRGINKFKKGYQPITNIVKDEKGDLITDFQSIWARCRKNFSHLHGANDVRQTGILTAETQVTESSALEFQVTVEKLKISILPGFNQILAKFMKARRRTNALRSKNLLILSALRRSCQRSGRSRSLYLSIRRAIKQIVAVTEAYQFLPTTYKILCIILL